jgi:Asp-tRNA(Asn)/Glu-tRNA(Gln) amidotransferase A subunit family amidase
VIAMLREQGACRIGFTAMASLACEPSGANPEQGRPVKPWSASHFCGGSSSGSAVAVAAASFLFRVTRSQTVIFSNSTKPLGLFKVCGKKP